MLNDIYERGVERLGLICADGLKGLEDVIAEVFPKTPLQRCTTHLKRNIISDVRIGNKREVAEDLKQVFRTGDRNYTVEKAWTEWQSFILIMVRSSVTARAAFSMASQSTSASPTL